MARRVTQVTTVPARQALGGGPRGRWCSLPGACGPTPPTCRRGSSRRSGPPAAPLKPTRPICHG